MDLRVRAGQHARLNIDSALSLGAQMIALRPRGPQGLRTILGMVDGKPARFQDAKAFERLAPKNDLIHLELDERGRIHGLPLGFFRRIVRAIPNGSSMPERVRLEPRYESCGCARPDDAHGAKERSAEFDERASGAAGPARLKYPIRAAHEFQVPAWLRDLQVYRLGLFFRDIIVERGALLTIEHATLAARHFMLLPGGRVEQKCSLVMDLTGSLRTAPLD